MILLIMIRRTSISTLFPTRRSSDLESNPVWVEADPKFRIYWGETHAHSGLSEGMGSIDGFYRWGRSEEHTSELQSRVDLVCRLLLEKKKKMNFGHELRKVTLSKA